MPDGHGFGRTGFGGFYLVSCAWIVFTGLAVIIDPQ